MKLVFSSERSDKVFSWRVVTRLRPVIDAFEATRETEVLVWDVLVCSVVLD